MPTRAEPTRAADLASVQAAFLAALAPRARSASRVPPGLFERPHGARLAERWHVHAHGYLARLTEALESAYPSVHRILGAPAFAALAARYLAAHPPRSYDLAQAGATLPAFLATDPTGRELPFLPDLARLERALAEAFVAPDAVPLAWEALRGVPEWAITELPLRLAPGAALVRSCWPLADLVATRGAKDEEVDVPLEERPRAFLVHRRGLAAVFTELDATAGALVELMAFRPTTLTELQEALAPGDAPETAAALVAAFRALVALPAFLDTTAAGFSGGEI